MSEIKSSNPHYIQNREQLLRYQRKYNELNPKIVRFLCTVCKRRGEPMQLVNVRLAKMHKDLTGHEFERIETKIRGNSPLAVIMQ